MATSTRLKSQINLKSQKINSNGCLLCGDAIKVFRKTIDENLIHSGESIQYLIGSFLSISQDELHYESSICRKCFNKINDLDKLITKAQRIKNDLKLIYKLRKREAGSLIEANEHIYYEITNKNEEEMDFKVKEEEVELSIINETLFVIEKEGMENFTVKEEEDISTLEESQKPIKIVKQRKSYKPRERKPSKPRPKKKYTCDICGKVYNQKAGLREHMDRDHLKQISNFVCSICGKAFPYKRYLVRHVLTHSDAKNHTCEICGAQFRKIDLLKRHIGSHSTERNFACSFCGKKYRTRDSRQCHIQGVHRGGYSRKIPCNLCHKTFQKQKMLRKHCWEDHNMEKFAAEFE